MAVKIFHYSQPETMHATGRWVPAASEEGYGSLEQAQAAAGRACGKESSTSWDEAGWVVSHEGLVVETREYNGYDDSDFYAICWNPVTESVEHVDYGSTRYWSYNSTAKVDAPAEVVEAARAFQAAARAAYAEALAKEEAERLAALPSKGKTVKVVKGRKIAKGTVGQVFWYGETQWGWRVGLEFGGQREFTAADNVEVVTAVTEAVAA